MDSRASIFLIGMMGAGKTTVGRLLAQSIGFEFIDVDREIESRSGVRIPTIFEIEGEDGFRRREAALLDELTGRERLVLATGGGAILDPQSRQRLRERGLVIYLRASSTRSIAGPGRTVRGRCCRPTIRVLRIEQLLAEREPLYAETAHLIVQSAASNPKRLVQRLLARGEVRAVIAAAA